MQAFLVVEADRSLDDHFFTVEDELFRESFEAALGASMPGRESHVAILEPSARVELALPV